MVSPVCSHRCLESSLKTEAPRRCWSHYRSNLCTAAPAERQEVDIISCVCVPVKCFPLFMFICCVSSQFMSWCVCALWVSTLPFSGRIIDWEWLSCCLASCRGAELWHWASALLNVIVLMVSDEAARCMLFTGVKGQRRMIGSVVRGGTDKQGRGQSLIYCVKTEQ